MQSLAPLSNACFGWVMCSIYGKKILFCILLFFYPFRVKLHLFVSNKTVLLVEAVVVVVHEAEVDPPVQEADLQKGSLVLAVHVDLIHQRNQSPLQGHQRGGDQPLQSIPDRVLVRDHRHCQFLPCLCIIF